MNYLIIGLSSIILSSCIGQPEKVTESNIDGRLNDQQISQSSKVEKVVSSRIIGGEPTLESNYMSTVALIKNKSSFCSGTLISKNQVLTAAHCLFGRESEFISAVRVHTGLGKKNTEGRIDAQHKIKNARKHPLYDFNGKVNHDYALLTLTQEVAGIVPTPIISKDKFAKELQVASNVKAVGFGLDEEHRYGKKNEVDLEITQINNLNIQAGEFSHSICRGDSGGSLFYEKNNKRYLIGVSSRVRNKKGGNDFYCYISDGAIFEKAHLAQNWIKSESSFIKGKELYQNEEYLKAIDFLKTSLEIYPKHMDAHIYLGMSKYELSKIDESITHFKNAIELGPMASGILHILGDIYLDKDELDQAMDYYLSSIKYHPGNEDVFSKISKHLGEKEALFTRALGYEYNGNVMELTITMGQLITKFENTLESDFVGTLVLFGQNRPGMTLLIEEDYEKYGIDIILQTNYRKRGYAHYASMLNRVDVFKKLKSLNVLNVYKTMLDENGNSILHLAAKFGSKESVKYLLENGFDKELKNNEGKSVSEIARDEDHSKLSLFIRFFGLTETKKIEHLLK